MAQFSPSAPQSPFASEAAEQLARAGHDPMVVDARFVKPLDPRLATWAREAGFVLTVEENVTSGGFGSAVMELLAEKDPRCLCIVWACRINSSPTAPSNFSEKNGA